MENIEISSAPTSPVPMTLDQEALSTLDEIRKWAFFLSILGFIGIGFVLLLGFFMGNIISTFTSQISPAFPFRFLSIFYLLFALLYFFPVFYLYRFSVQMKIAIHQNSQESLNSSFGNLKSLFRFLGIFTIIVLSLYLIVFITVIVVFALKGS